MHAVESNSSLYSSAALTKSYLRLQDVVDTPAAAAPDASQAIAGLPGVDPNDPSVQAALRNVQGEKKDEGSKEGK